MQNKNISLIIAVAENNAIGKDNALIWRLSDDLKNFKRLTTGHSVIMGRKTYESIGKPLPNRSNIVVSRSEDLQIEGCHVVHSLEAAFELAAELEGDEEIFVIGGANIYEQALPHINKVYLTRVYTKPEADAFFDPAVFVGWEVVGHQFLEKSESNEFDSEILTLLKDQAI
jgi:dihydrofolate reductase